MARAKFNRKINITLTGSAFTDELHADVGAAVFNINHDWFWDDDSSGENIIIRTAAAGGGTLLTRDTDYTISNQDSYLSTESGGNVYSDITIINATFQTGNLYFSGKYIADSVSQEDVGQVTFDYEAVSTSQTLAPIGYTTYGCTAGTNGIRLTLPASSGTYENIKLEFVKLDSTDSAVTLVPNGSETISGQAFIFLIERYQKITIMNTGSGWIITQGPLVAWSGYVGRSDWTNVHIGTADITYDGKVGTFLTGELVKEATSNNTGVVVGQTATVLYIWCATGNGIWTNDRVVTGQISAATCVVNNASTTKNLDANFYHGFGKSAKELSVQFFYVAATSYTEANLHGIAAGAIYSDIGSQIDGVDTNSFLLHTGATGVNALSGGGVLLLDAEDYMYAIRAVLNF